MLGGGLVLLTVAAVALLGWAGGFIAQRIPFSYEQDMAAGLSGQLESGDPQVEAWLQRLADSLAADMGLPEGMSVTVHFVDADTVNALATLGGHIVIYRGLLEKVADENALAMVVAHEVAHVKHRDPVVALGRGVLVGTVLAVVSGASGNDAAGRLLGETGLLTGLSFSREQERRADRAALAALARRYGHVGGATAIFQYFRRQEQDDGFGMPELFRTHPASGGRIGELRALAREQGWPEQGARTPLPAFVQSE